MSEFPIGGGGGMSRRSFLRGLGGLGLGLLASKFAKEHPEALCSGAHPEEAKYWNPYNGVHQCHICGEQYTPLDLEFEGEQHFIEVEEGAPMVDLLDPPDGWRTLMLPTDTEYIIYQSGEEEDHQLLIGAAIAGDWEKVYEILDEVTDV